VAITCRGEVCDARYSKACGGRTEQFDTAWENRTVPYLLSVPDARIPYRPIGTEKQARDWILSAPDAFCHTDDKVLLEKILPDFDRSTTGFFRWTVRYRRGELEEIVREKSGIDFGTLKEMSPLTRGPSGRISRLKITGSKKSMIVGKELEIRRWLSPTHLYSSAFVVEPEPNARTGKVDAFVLHGAGWGHGVGLCQIGAAGMASRGSSAEEILKHYFTGIELRKIY
jgi:stage II sporulation protein D